MEKVFNVQIARTGGRERDSDGEIKASGQREKGQRKQGRAKSTLPGETSGLDRLFDDLREQGEEKETHRENERYAKLRRAKGGRESVRELNNVNTHGNEMKKQATKSQLD